MMILKTCAEDLKSAEERSWVFYIRLKQRTFLIIPILQRIELSVTVSLSLRITLSTSFIKQNCRLYSVLLTTPKLNPKLSKFPVSRKIISIRISLGISNSSMIERRSFQILSSTALQKRLRIAVKSSRSRVGRSNRLLRCSTH